MTAVVGKKLIPPGTNQQTAKVPNRDATNLNKTAKANEDAGVKTNMTAGEQPAVARTTPLPATFVGLGTDDETVPAPPMTSSFPGMGGLDLDRTRARLAGNVGVTAALQPQEHDEHLKMAVERGAMVTHIPGQTTKTTIDETAKANQASRQAQREAEQTLVRQKAELTQKPEPLGQAMGGVAEPNSTDPLLGNQPVPGSNGLPPAADGSPAMSTAEAVSDEAFLK